MSAVGPLLAGALLLSTLTACADATEAATPAPSSTFTAGEAPVLVPGSPGQSTTTVAPGEAGSLANPALYTDADVAFVTGMVPHHAQALRMADLAEARAQDERVMLLAERIASAQGPEIEPMQAWLSAQGLPEADEDGGMTGMTGMPGEDGMTGMLSPEQLLELDAARGATFDRMFLELMTLHHEGAIAMAEAASDARHPIVVGMVDDTVASQGAEIGRMQELLAEL